MRLINCLMFPGGEQVVYCDRIDNCWILMPGEYIRLLDDHCEWKFRHMKMGFAEYKKRYIDRG